MKKDLYKFSEIKKNTPNAETDLINSNYFTSSNENQSYGGHYYSATTISHSEIESKSEIAKSDLKVYFSINNSFARSFLNDVDSFLMLELIEYETSTTDVLISWKGRLQSISVENDKIVFNMISVFSSLRRFGLNRVFQRTCPHTLYGPGCNLDAAAFEVSATITNIVGRTLTFSSGEIHTDGYYTYGFVKDADGNSRMIMNHTGNTLLLEKQSNEFNLNFESGSFAVTLYPGCTKNRNVCDVKFNNVENYGGFPLLPVKNPFDLVSFL